jgi:hypothetical protein
MNHAHGGVVVVVIRCCNLMLMVVAVIRFCCDPHRATSTVDCRRTPPFFVFFTNFSIFFFVFSDH